MKYRLFVIVAAILMVPMGLLGQTYQTLWKQVEEAQNTRSLRVCDDILAVLVVEVTVTFLLFHK